MALLRTLSFAALLAFTGLGVASCLSPPDYPDTPEISFSKIESNKIVKREGAYDTVAVTISFKDGDGDLGLNNEDTNSPFNEFNVVNGDTVANIFYNNYFITPQIRESNGTYADLVLAFDYNSRYPRLTPEAIGDRKAPLRGDLTFGFIISEGALQTIRPDLLAPFSVRFKVYILDRALHESNEVITTPITIQ